MTGTRVLTALVLIPIVIGIVLFTPTWAVAIATALITVLALWEYFSLGDAIGHRAYRMWTIFCSLVLLLSQFIDVVNFAFRSLGSGPFTWGIGEHYLLENTSLGCVLFLFVLGLTCLTLWTRRPLVEALPSAGISASALLLVTFPLSYAIRLHGFGKHGPVLLLFALAITWAADTSAYFVGRAIGKHPLAPHISPKKTWEGSLPVLLVRSWLPGAFLTGCHFRYRISLPWPRWVTSPGKWATCSNPRVSAPLV